MDFRQLLVAVGFALIVTGAVCAAPIDDLNVGPTAPSPTPLIRLPELEAASLAFKKGKIDDCIDLLDAAREKTLAASAGELPPTNLMLARLYLSYGHVAQGKAMLEKVAVEFADHPEVYLLFGNVAANEGRLTDAMLHFERSVGFGRRKDWTDEQWVNLHREAQAGLARVAEKREDWFRAQDALKKWSNIDPGNSQIRDRMGAALFMLGREREAFDQFQTAARQDSNLNEAEVSMAVMYARKQDFAKAREVFDAALAKYPKDGRVAYELSAMLLMSGNPREAKTFSDKAALLDIDTPELTMQRGYIARQLKEYNEAERHFAKMLEQSPSHFEASNQLALVLVEQDDPAKKRRAQELAELNVRRFPESSNALSTLGWVQYKLGRRDQAEKTLRLAGSKPNVRTETLYFLLRVLWENGRKEDAQRVAKQAKDMFDSPGLFVLRDEAQQFMSDEFVN